MDSLTLEMLSKGLIKLINLFKWLLIHALCFLIKDMSCTMCRCKILADDKGSCWQRHKWQFLHILKGEINVSIVYFLRASDNKSNNVAKKSAIDYCSSSASHTLATINLENLQTYFDVLSSSNRRKLNFSIFLYKNSALIFRQNCRENVLVWDFFSCWQLWFHEKNCQKKCGGKTCENVGVFSKLNFWTKVALFLTSSLVRNCAKWNCSSWTKLVSFFW